MKNKTMNQYLRTMYDSLLSSISSFKSLRFTRTITQQKRKPQSFPHTLLPTFFIMPILMFDFRTIVLVLAIMLGSASAQVPSPKPSEYNTLVNKCFSNYKLCAVGLKNNCETCEVACGEQQLLRENTKFATVCTLLRDYCKDRRSSPGGDTWTETKCITYNRECLQKGLDDASCGYCASACRACPKQYKECRPNASVVPTPPPGCFIQACTYYSNLCRLSNSPKFCQFCVSTCSSLCDDEADSCRPFVPDCSNAIVSGTSTLEASTQSNFDSPFNDASAVTNCIYNPITKVTVRHDKGILGIETTFRDGTVTDNGSQGGRRAEIELLCGERINRVVYRRGIFVRLDVISELTIFTSKGRTFGPYGGNLQRPATPVTVDFKSDYLLYFFGRRTGIFIGRIGFGFGRFEPGVDTC